MEKYNDYVAFLIADHISKEAYEKYGWTCDEVWGHCIQLAQLFEKSEFNDFENALYECVYDFMDYLSERKELLA